MKRITGIGGVFIKASDPKFLARWYEDHLGIPFGTNVYASLKWRNANDTNEICTTAFSFFPENTTYFLPGEKKLMLNFRVENLRELLPLLQTEGVNVLEKTEEYEYGKFGWVMDPEGNKIELWEPHESGFGESPQSVPVSGPVNGLGGIFIKSSDPKKLAQWYADHFQLNFQGTMCMFRWKQVNDAQKDGTTVLSFFKEDTQYFKPSDKSYMLNLNVNQIEQLTEELRTSQIPVAPKVDDSEYGKFSWLMDAEGNKIELWESNKS
ncbi:MAG: VOC family protein [Bacteroidia bacterium]